MRNYQNYVSWEIVLLDCIPILTASMLTEKLLLLQELQAALKCISPSDQLINQTAKKRGSNSSIVHTAEAGIRKLYGYTTGDYPDSPTGGRNSIGVICSRHLLPQAIKKAL